MMDPARPIQHDDDDRDYNGDDDGSDDDDDDGADNDLVWPLCKEFAGYHAGQLIT